MDRNKRLKEAVVRPSLLPHDDFVDVVVVGAGLSGLSAARKILNSDPGLKVLIIEAKDRVGGRTVGQKLVAASGHDTWDLGGQWIGGCQPHIMKLVKELQLETYPQFTTGRKVMELDDDRVKYYDSDIPSLPFLSLIDLHLFMRKLDKMRRSINPVNPGICPHGFEWDSMTLEDFKQRHLWTKGAKESLDSVVRCAFGADPVHISLLYFLTYISCAGGLEPLISAKMNFGGQELKIKGGAWQICEELAKQVPKEFLLLSTPVGAIIQDGDVVKVETTSGQTINCSYVLMAIPPHLTGQVHFQPTLPLEKRHVFHRMPVGYLTKVIVTYKTAFWRAAGFSGEAVSSGGKTFLGSATTGPLCIVFDATSPNGNPAVVAFIGGSQQIEYSSIPSADRQLAVLHSLAKYFGQEALSPLDYCEKNWNEEPYNGGCPVSVGTPGMMTHMASALRLPFGRVHFAGTESATCWSGFLNGAVQAGERAATEVLYNLRPQAVTAADLEGTAYDLRRMPDAVVCRTNSSWFRVAAGIGFLFITATALWKYRTSQD